MLNMLVPTVFKVKAILKQLVNAIGKETVGDTAPLLPLTSNLAVCPQAIMQLLILLITNNQI